MRMYVDSDSVLNAVSHGKASILEYPLAMHYRVVPVEQGEGRPLLLVTPVEQDIATYRRLRFLLRREVLFVHVSRERFDGLDDATWEGAARSGTIGDTTDARFTATVAGGAPDAGGSAHGFEACFVDDGAPEQVDRILSRAVAVGASDIHFEPAEDDLRVRFRMDGVLHPMAAINKTYQSEILSRLKILAGMDIAEKRRPQDGRILVQGTGKDVDVRVSAMPTPHGEKIVLRLLDKTRQALDLSAIGMEGENLTLFREAIEKPDGMILVTGPTGSGKTTTLYAALKTILSSHINISTVEDPIEYLLSGINQTQMHAEIGYTFAAAIRTFLRQDPDVIMVGEIRDAETAKYAIQAAQTGHLVFSTLHTNDAPGAVVRLLEMGVEPYLVASTVHLIMAQRLVRRICPDCRATRPATPDERRYIGIDNGDPLDIAYGTGCERCASSGFRGRIGVFELMSVTPEVQELIAEKASTQRIREVALKQGMRPLRAEAVRLVRGGVTTVTEVKEVVG